MKKENCKYCKADEEEKDGASKLYWSEPRKYTTVGNRPVKYFFTISGDCVTEHEITRFEYHQHEEGHPELNEEEGEK